MASPHTVCEKGHFDVRTICKELAEVENKFIKIGVQLGIPRYKLMEFKKDDDPLSAMIDYWFSGNVEGVHVSWQSIVDALQTSYVGESGLAEKIIEKYIDSQQVVEGSSNHPQAQSVASLAVTSSGSNSSGPLSAVDFKDFQYLHPGEMSEDEFTYFLNQLRKETRNIQGDFGSLWLSLKKDMEARSIKLEDVVSLLLFTIQDDGFKELMESCKNLTDVFRNLFKYVSFYDLYLVKLLIRNFCSTSMKKKLKRYKKKFQDYCKRRICECPKDTFSGAEKSDKIFKIKTDKILESYTLEDLDKLQHEIREILGRKLLHLLKIEDGCVRLTFRVVNDDLDISDKQKLALSNLGVLSLKCGSKIVNISTCVLEKASPDIISDSGYHSKLDTETSTEKGYSKVLGTHGNRKGDTEWSEVCSIKKEKDLIDPRIDMLTSVSTERTELPNFTPLYIAAQEDNLEMVKQLIEMGENPLDKDINDDTLLHFSASTGKLSILKYLVEDVGCNPATEGYQGSTTLHLAAHAGQLHIVKYLIEQCQLDPTALDHIKCTPLVHACLQGSLDIVRYLIECMQDHYKPEDVLYNSYEAVNELTINSPLCTACFRGNYSVIKYLIEECNCDPSQPSKNLTTPVLAAVSGNHLDLVKYLTITKQVKVDEHSIAKILFTSAAHQNLEMVKFLKQLTSCDLNSKYNNISPLYAAASVGCLKIVKYLLSLNCDPFIKSEHGRLPIHAAAANGHYNVVKFLVEEYSYDPTALDEQMITPLYIACQYGHLSVIRYLTLEHRCDPLVARESSDIYEKTSLHCAITYEHIDVVRYFVEELKCDPNTKFNHPVFHSIANESGDHKFAKILIDELGFDPLIENCRKQTAVHVSAINGNLPLLRYLIEDQKCDPNTRDVRGNTALILSAGKGNLHILQYLINNQKIDKNSYNPETFITPLCAAAAFGHQEVIAYLMEIGSDHCDKTYKTPIHHAIDHGQVEIVKYLMTLYPKMYSLHPHITPLQAATIHGKLDIVKYFLEEARCNPNIVDPDGSTLVHMAAAQGYVDIVNYLVCDMKCDPLKEDKTHDTPLLLACQRGRLEVLKYYFTKLNINPKASVTITGDKPIHVAARWGHLNVVKYLVEELKCHVNSVNTQSFITPIHYAARKGYLDIVQYLIKKKANIVCYNVHGDTPLHAAATGNQLQIVKYLMSKGNSVNIKMKRTPLHVALETSKGSLSVTALYLIVCEFNSLQ